MTPRRSFSAGPTAKAPAPRGLLEAVACALCLWAAAWHTPAGALLRHAAAKVTGGHTRARPLLAYYSGGTWDSDVLPPQPRPLPSGERPLVLPQTESTLALLPAVGRGVFMTWSQLPAAEQAPARALAARHQVAFPASAEDRAVPAALVATLQKETAELGSLDAAVLAAFLSHDQARFAAQRTRAEGKPPTLDALAGWLPNGAGEEVARASKALSLGTAFALAWPVEVPARISSPFGYRTHPTLGTRQLHTGVDIAVASGTQVRVVADGVVRRASEDALNGRVVIVDHGHGVSTAYCHNEELLVATGQKVTAGMVISHSGTTGRSTGPHLHYQLELGRSPVDPLAFRAAPISVASVSDAPGSGTPPPMENIKVLMMRVRDPKELEDPRYHSAQASGMDLLADLEDDIYLEPLGRALVPTGLSFAIPEGYEGQVRPRSGMGHRQGLTVLNSPGTIDADYRGEVKVLIANISSKSVVLRRGDRIAQLIFAPVARATLVAATALPATERGDGGFGSTGGGMS